MKKIYFMALLSMLLFQHAYSQVTIRGKITDELGETLLGVNVFPQSNPEKGSTSDFDGNYSLRILSSGADTIVFSYIGYNVIKVPLLENSKGVIVLNHVLQPTITGIDEVVVIGRKDRSSEIENKAIQIRKAAALDYISGETIKKTGDSQVDDAIKRVTGVSKTGDFITVRGLSDRYVSTTLNGARIPTLDPLTNNIKLDIFPTNLINTIMITKTQSPDVPSGWAGAYIDIETKDYPDKLSVGIKSSFGFNSNAHFKKILAGQRGPTDWLGYDKDYRDIELYDFKDPSTFPDYAPLDKGRNDDNDIKLYTYDQIKALNDIGAISDEYFNSLNLDRDSKLEGDNIYHRLTLIELDLLEGPGLIGNEAKVFEANQVYEDLYNEQVFLTSNEDFEQFASSLPNNWLTTERTHYVNFSQNITIGNRLTLFGQPLGMLAGFRYYNSVKHSPEYTLSNAEGTHHITETSKLDGWSALLSLSYNINTNNRISLLYMPNFIGENRIIYDSINPLEPDFENHLGLDFIVRPDQKYEERQFIIYQMETFHYIPFIKAKLELNASFTDGRSGIPDTKEGFGYAGITDSVSKAFESYATIRKSEPYRLSQYINEDIFDSKASLSIPLGQKQSMVRKIMLGGSYQLTQKEQDVYHFRVRDSRQNNEISLINNLEKYYYNENLFSPYWNVRTRPDGSTEEEGRVNLYYENQHNGSNFIYGEKSISSAYMMTDYSVIKKLRVTGGLRIEYGGILNDGKAYKGLPADDPKRAERSYRSGLNYSITVPVNRYNLNYLPSINVIYKLYDNNANISNIRLCYGRSLARPSMRELSPTLMKDFVEDAYLIGNPELKNTLIDNYDFRIESWFPESNQSITLSLFYKDFNNPIVIRELLGDFITWENIEKTITYGLEVDARKRLLIENLYLSANFALIYGYAKNKKGPKSWEEPIYGQAPYIINALIDYTSDKYGIMTSVSYNLQGPRIIRLGDYESSYARRTIRDIYEMPRHLVDAKINKKLGENFTVELKIRNLLDKPQDRHSIDSYRFPEENDYEGFPVRSFDWGREYVIGISMNF